MWWFLSCILGFIRLYLDGVKVVLYQLFNRSFTLPDLPKQNGKVAIVTGGTRGMGYEISRHLVSLDMHVIIAGNEEEEGLAVVKKIQKLNQGKGDDLLHLDPIPLNLQLNGIIFLAMFGLVCLLEECVKASRRIPIERCLMIVFAEEP
ncbi:Dehydrogenase/reductase SDR family member on chromosome X [Anabarilius grahami]|uniref:Dehydrogenase/reductase SDR family member on chromosome X n=1 Tax=Anabarilius grahami TaxID=495550 RepID=A0A3N0Y8S1_ANAGA|nr:Dehydrogenase/reductase SDR family member on chromosome X [Anabarilius grahami]